MLGNEQQLLNDNVHVFRVRVYYEDTDAAGIVYYANYFRFAERARTEMLRSAKIDQNTLFETSGVRFVVRSCNIEYLKPARLDDELEVHTRIRGIRGASLVAKQIVQGDQGTTACLDLRIACVDQFGLPTRLPVEVRSALETYLQVSQEAC